MNLPTYSGCGNTFFIYHLASEQDFLAFRADRQRMQQLATQAIEHTIDSVMVVYDGSSEQEKESYHLSMHVFEPRGFRSHDIQSGWSTMCGNGLRAVAQYLFDTGIEKTSYIIRSGAGDHKIVRTTHGLWSVDMGWFAHTSVDLSSYVCTQFPIRLSLFFSSFFRIFLKPTIHVGFHFHNTQVKDGEPHAIIFTKFQLSRSVIIRLAEYLGKKITYNNNIFPKEINTSVASIYQIDSDTKSVFVRAATYERHIYYVTQACGTAATVIGSFIFQQLHLDHSWHVIIDMPGGELLVSVDVNGKYYLTGDAKRNTL